MKKSITLIFSFLTITQLICAQVAQNSITEKYQAHMYQDMPYRLMTPTTFNPDQKYPIILSLHGAGGRGSDNLKQLRKWNEYLAINQIRDDYQCYVLAPQSNKEWDSLQFSKIKKIIHKLKYVDMTRIYILGHSMGGHGTFKFIQLAPDYFAAAAPSAGTGLATTEDFIDVSKIKDIPIWVFHGDKDPKCPYEKGEKIFQDMKIIGGNMKFTTWVVINTVVM